jgi:hypothetical protein
MNNKRKLNDMIVDVVVWINITIDTRLARLAGIIVRFSDPITVPLLVVFVS